MNWITNTLFWYGHLLLIGIIFFPITKKLFSRFFDFGYPFSKTLGIIILSYLAFALGILHILPFSQISLYVLLLLAGIVNAYIFWKDTDLNNLIQHLSFKKVFVFLFEEAFFIASLYLLAYIRGQEPSIHGLEKFMDYGFINSILRSHFFPPLDMWYSGGPDVNSIEHATYPINYYYFGHLTGAVLIKLTSIPSYIGYNLILATIFAQGMTLVFSLVANIIHVAQKLVVKFTKYSTITTFVFGFLGSLVVNLAGNLHTIYLFTKGYSNDTPEPFWHIWSYFNPGRYWYPNATRFIPFTIHEFPSYSYVVADLHGHVFDIPFVLLTLSLLFNLFSVNYLQVEENKDKEKKRASSKVVAKKKPVAFSFKTVSWSWFYEITKNTVLSIPGALTSFLGFMCAVHYTTNASDGLIYLGLSCIIFLWIYKLTPKFFIHAVLLAVTFAIFSLPFSSHFKLFVSGVGVNCPPNFLFQNIQPNGTDTAHITFKSGPFLFEKGNCQKSPIWMQIVLWGFFWLNFLILLGMRAYSYFIERKNTTTKKSLLPSLFEHLNYLDLFMITIFVFGTLLIEFAEFFYFKDIYPAHFRANTLFKFGYQAYIMMGIASMYVLYRLRLFVAPYSLLAKILAGLVVFIYLLIFRQPIPADGTPVTGFRFEPFLILPFIIVLGSIFYYRSIKAFIGLLSVCLVTNAIVLILIYSFFAFPAYYGNLQKTDQERQQEHIQTSLDGIQWLKLSHPEDYDIVAYINKHIKGQPTILEAQGDSYTDYDGISSYTGLPTVSGWWVHEWLWRGSADVVGKRIPDIQNIFESNDIGLTKELLKKYHVKYVVIDELARQKYSNLNEQKFNQIGKKIYQSSNGLGALYQVEK